MKRLNGLTKAAHKSAGNSQMCYSCPLHKNKMCSPDINRACYDSHIEGFKKGAHFSIDKVKKAIAMFNHDFGTDLNKRLKKLEEETTELIQAIAEYNSGLNGIEAVKDEMSDVIAVITHVSSLLGTNPRNLFFEAVDKITKRKEDTNYKRTHPHTEYKRKELKNE